MKIYVWVNLLTEASVDSLVLGLIKKGATVAPLNPNGNLFEKAYGSCLVALAVEPKIENKDQIGVGKEHDFCVEILKESKVLWHALIVSSSNIAVSWSTGNITEPPTTSKTVLERVSSDGDILT